MGKNDQEDRSSEAHNSPKIDSRRPPWMALLITNISKPANIRSLLLSAHAFGFQKIFVCSQPKFDFDHNNANNDVPTQLREPLNQGEFQIIRFRSFDDCIEHIHTLDAKILGVEIHQDAVDVEDETCFTGNTVLIMGNEAMGMGPKQSSVCDGFVRISQYGKGTASLNVNVAASIVMHRFQIWARTKT